MIAPLALAIEATAPALPVAGDDKQSGRVVWETMSPMARLNCE